MSKTISQRIKDIANKFNVSYEDIKILVYSNYGDKIITENEKLNILENYERTNS
jgi:hypothetical protein